MNKYEIDNFLSINNFKAVNKKTSDFFGDYSNVFVNDFIALKFTNDRDYKSIDVSNKNFDEWFDVALVKALLYNEINLNKSLSYEGYCDFLIKDFEKVEALFLQDYFADTKIKLNRLSERRVKQMFS